MGPVVSYERKLLQPDTNLWQRGVHEENICMSFERNRNRQCIGIFIE
jgi:hypothetical protein